MINDKICNFNNGNKIEVINNNVYVDGNLLEFLGSGVDGYVYKYEEKAIKLYHDDYQIKDHLSSEQIDILCSIFTKHIVLPKERLISNDNNPGFVMNYIDLDTKKDILLVDKSELIEQLRGLEEELILIGKEYFLLNDMQAQNLFYNGNFYLFDADSLLYDKGVDFSSRNLEIFVWYFMRDVIFFLNDKLNRKEQVSFVRKMHYLYKKGNYSLLSDFCMNL